MSEHSIGKITIADGVVVIQRDNQSIELQEGDSIYLNDIVEAKSGSVGLTFTDGTTFSIDAGSQVVVDEFVYDPGNTGSMNISVLAGNFSYISGEISKMDGDVYIVTPTATLTVQGTNVAGKVSLEGGGDQIVLLPNADGTVGQVLITNQSGSVLLTEAFQSTTIASAFMPPTVPVIIPEAIVLEEFGTTINTIQKTKKLAKQQAEEEEVEDPFEEEVDEEELEELEEELEEETQPVVDEETVIEDDIFEEELIVEEEEDLPVVEDTVIEDEIIEEDTTTEEEEDTTTEEEEDPYIPPVITDPDPFFTDPTVDEEDIYVPLVTEDDNEEDIYVPPVVEEEEEEVNEAPTFETTSTTTLAESLSSGSTVSTMSATDPNNDSITYSISSGNDAGKFTINSSTGAITTAATLDYETTTSYTLVIAASDGTLTTTTSKTINITDVDEGSSPVAANNTAIINEGGTLSVSNGASANSITSGAVTYSSGDAFSVASQENKPASLSFNNDGTKMFVAGNTGDDINEYHLSTAWDVSTASYDSNFDLSGQLNEAYGVAWNLDGTKMFVADAGGGDDINEYTLTTAFDVSTASFVDALSVSSKDSRPCGIRFNADGTKLYVTGFYNDFINEYNLSTAFDISTGSYSKQFDVDDWDVYPRDVQFNPDGTRMWVVGGAGDDINEFTLSTAFDVSTASYKSVFTLIGDHDSNPFSMAFNNDGTKMFMLGYNEDKVHEYNLLSPYNLIDVTGEHDGDVLGDDSDADGDTLVVASVRLGATEGSGNAGTLGSALTGTYGQLTMNANGSYTYVANQSAADDLDAGDTATDSFNYTVSDGTGGTDTATLIITVIGKGVESVSGSTNSATAATWGANYSEDMVLNNAWANDKILVVGTTNQYFHGSGGPDDLIFDNLGYTSTYEQNSDTGTNNNLKYWSQFEQVWNFNFADDDIGSEKIYLDYLRSGGSIAQFGEWYDADSHTGIENFVAIIDDDITDANKTSIIAGNTKFGGSSFTTTTEAYTVPSAYNVSTWGTGGSGTETSGEADTGTREDGVAAAGTFDVDHMGSGDLITPSSYNNNTDKGFIAEWDGGDSNTEYYGTFVGWLDSNPGYSGGDLRTAYDVVEWMEDQAEAVTGGITTDTEYLPVGGLKTTYGWTNTNNNTKSSVEAYNLGNNVYIGGGFDHLDWVWDYGGTITGASAETGYSVASQETGPRELAFSSDGTKFFVTGYQGNDVGEYHMSTAWDVSTASYDSAFGVGSSLGGYSHGLAFNTDGTKMFVSGYYNNNVGEYTLSTGWDVSTASFVDSFVVTDQDTEPRGLAFSSDGTKMFISGNAGDTIEEYTLSTGFDVSSASHTDSMDVSSYDNNPRGITFNDDGTYMFFHGQQNDKIHSWNLSTGYDISTGTYIGSQSLPSVDTGAEAIVFSSDGSKLFVSGNDDNTIDEYTLFSGFDDWDKAYVAVNSDMDGADEDDAPTVADDHYLVVGADTDGDGNLWETTDVFDLDKIFIKDDSADFLTQDSDASGDYYFKITPVTHDGSSWNVETDNTVTLTNTTGYNDYLDLTSNTDFDDINYAIIETESALISEVIVSY